MESTITAEQAAESIWDAVVIGSGPAGALTARQLAVGGRRVILLDAKKFPRDKVCGGCINELALSVLSRVGLQALIDDLPALPIREYVLNWCGRTVGIAASGGIAVSRVTLDLALVRAAVQSGVSFLDGTTGILVPSQGPVDPLRADDSDGFREVQLEATGTSSVRLHGRVIVIADGLARRSLQRTSEFFVKTASNSWIGLHSNFPVRDDQYPIGQVRMLIAPSGYVGTVRIDHDTVNLAAAVSPDELKRHGTPEAFVSQVFDLAGVSAPMKTGEMSWQGTGPLTRRSQTVAGERVVIVGDAAGYVEPFTGEGVGHAVLAAIQVADILLGSQRVWDPAMSIAWNTCYRRQVANRQWVCRGLAVALHNPWVANLAFHMARLSPAIPQLVANCLNTRFKSATPG